MELAIIWVALSITGGGHRGWSCLIVPKTELEHLRVFYYIGYFINSISLAIVTVIFTVIFTCAVEFGKTSSAKR